MWILKSYVFFCYSTLKKLSVWFYFRKASEGLKSLNPDETAPSMRLLAYGKLEVHSVIEGKKIRLGIKAVFISYIFRDFR